MKQLHIARYALRGSIHYGVVDDGVYHRLQGSPFESLDFSGHEDLANEARLLAPTATRS